MYAEHDKRRGNWVNFNVEIQDMKTWRDWKNSDNPSYAPQIIYEDLSGDGKKDVIIILTHGHGSGFLEQEAHVFINEYWWGERLIEDPLIIGMKHIQSRIYGPKGKEIAEITVRGKTSRVSVGKFINLYQDVGFGRQIWYEVKNNKLYAFMDASASPAASIGSFEIEYEYKQKIFQMKSIEFKTTLENN
ncbi:hypothetical protein [Ammoniphilus sp. 3BR4]|uniref:hypothetical protein n=1 Tax=Ammoniphilus sp. 3BR4 TaxID=3158265 RepID=UPI003466F1AD